MPLSNDRDGGQFWDGYYSCALKLKSTMGMWENGLVLGATRAARLNYVGTSPSTTPSTSPSIGSFCYDAGLDQQPLSGSVKPRNKVISPCTDQKPITAEYLEQGTTFECHHIPLKSEPLLHLALI